MATNNGRYRMPEWDYERVLELARGAEELLDASAAEGWANVTAEQLAALVNKNQKVMNFVLVTMAHHHQAILNLQAKVFGDPEKGD